jgi:hypothetical protein
MLTVQEPFKCRDFLVRPTRFSGGYHIWQNFFLVTVILILASFLTSFSSGAQIPNNYSQGLYPEKIYLQTDGKVYSTDQTIWFKAIVVDGVSHIPDKLSRILYVELIGPNERIIEKKLIRLENGIGNGFFGLSPNSSAGEYLIRAYTEWNKNFGTDFFFTEYIHVLAFSASPKVDPIGKITLLKGQNNDYRLMASLNPSVIDSLHKKDLTLILTMDEKKDTLIIRKNKDNVYSIDYILPLKCQFVNLKMKTSNQITFTKTIALDEDYLDLRFFPESGELVDGLRSKVGVKTLDSNGKGKSVEGVILTREGEVVANFKTNPLGMGSFVMPRVEDTTSYFAQINSQTQKNLVLVYPLPLVIPRGNVLSVFKTNDKILIRTSSNYLENDSIYLIISCRGLIYYVIKEGLNNGTYSLSIPCHDLPEGIIVFTMTDNTMRPLAERLYFNEIPERRINIGITADKDTFLQRELTKLSVVTKSFNGEALKANFSILVLNKTQLGEVQSNRQNILTRFLLSSELRGEIENPGYYFRKDSNKFNELDALLITQGWRKYLFNKSPDRIIYNPEAQLSVSGTVTGVFSKKKKKADLTMLTFGRIKSVHKQNTDSLGRFLFILNDEYGQKMNVAIQSADKNGNNRDYKITLDTLTSPSVTFDHARTIGGADSVVQTIFEKNLERKQTEDKFSLGGTILLDEVVVNGLSLFPQRKKVIEQFGLPDEIINGKDIEAKEQKWSYGLYSVLMYGFPGSRIRIENSCDGTTLSANVANHSPTLVVIDGKALKSNEYDLIPYISPADVKGVDVIENAMNFSKLYLDAFSSANLSKSPLSGNVIAIYTYSGKGIFGTQRSVGIVKASVPVFSFPREFYAPKYDLQVADESNKPDLRSLIEWEPVRTTDSEGKATASFYNADVVGDMLVVVEAISETGEIGYREFTYHVKKNEVLPTK